MFTKLLYLFTIGFFLFSYFQDRNKTRQAIQKSIKAFLNVMPSLAAVLGLVGLVLTLLSPDTIGFIIGRESGFFGMLATSIVGAVTLIPGFVAFPLAASLLERGAGIMQIAVFISTLMMVGFVTMPLEMKYFGRKETLLRNGFSYLYAFAVALVIGAVVS